MKKRVDFIFLFTFLAIGLCVGAFFDLQVNQLVYNAASVPAILMEAYGFFPLYLPVALAFAMLCIRFKSKAYLSVLFAAFYVTTLSVLFYMGGNYMVKRGLAQKNYWLLCAATVAVIAFVIIIKTTPQTQKKLWFLGVVGSVYMVINNVIINLLKFIWQRPRFDDMLTGEGLSAFRAWFMPFGTGGSSFPSGHTGAACGIFVLLCLCSVFKFWHKKYALMQTICWAYVAFMAVCRIIIGRHFISDTVAAAFIGYGILIVIQSTNAYKKALADTITACDEAG